jgi:hypothetical protein
MRSQRAISDRRGYIRSRYMSYAMYTCAMRSVITQYMDTAHPPRHRPGPGAGRSSVEGAGWSGAGWSGAGPATVRRLGSGARPPAVVGCGCCCGCPPPLSPARFQQVRTYKCNNIKKLLSNTQSPSCRSQARAQPPPTAENFNALLHPDSSTGAERAHQPEPECAG